MAWSPVVIDSRFERRRPPPRVDKGDRLFVLFCSAGFLAIAVCVAIVVVKILL